MSSDATDMPAREDASLRPSCRRTERRMAGRRWTGALLYAVTPLLPVACGADTDDVLRDPSSASPSSTPAPTTTPNPTPSEETPEPFPTAVSTSVLPNDST